MLIGIEIFIKCLPHSGVEIYVRAEWAECSDCMAAYFFLQLLHQHRSLISSMISYWLGPGYLFDGLHIFIIFVKLVKLLLEFTLPVKFLMVLYN